MAMWLKETFALLEKEFRIEWRQRYASMGLLLYSGVMVFLVALVAGGSLSPEIWNMIFWILMLFISINAVARSFMSESRGQMLYQFQLAGPLAFFASKLIFNFLVLGGLGCCTALLYNFFAPQTVGNPGLYIAGILAGSLGFSANLTLVSSIASGAGNRSTLFAVLSFPLTLPLLVMALRTTQKAMEGKTLVQCSAELGFICFFIVIISGVSFILFPSLWRE